MSNEACARVKIDALLAAQGWDTLDTNAARSEVMLSDGFSECARSQHIVAPAAAEKNFGED